MKQALRLLGLAVLLVACSGNGGEDAGGAEAVASVEPEGESSPAAGSRAVITIEGGALAGVWQETVDRCQLDHSDMEIFTERNREGNNAFLWMFDTTGDGAASFQIVQTEDVFFNHSVPISYTIEDNRLIGSGGELDGDDPGVVSVEVFCE